MTLLLSLKQSIFLINEVLFLRTLHLMKEMMKFTLIVNQRVQAENQLPCHLAVRAVINHPLILVIQLLLLF